MTAALLTRLERQRQQAIEAADALVETRTGHVLNMADATRLEGLLDDADRATERLDRVAVSVGREPMTYTEGGSHSFFFDLVSARAGHRDADARLQRHRQETTAEVERRDILRRRAWERAAEPLGMTREYRDLTRVDGTGGYFVPPLWLLDQVGVFPRSGRVLADRLTMVPLPSGTDSVSVPRLTTGAAVAAQTADNTAVQETDPAEAAVTAPVRTIAGQVDAAVQVVDQTGAPGFDRLVYEDLLADYAAKLEAQIINGSGASGQLAGLIGAAATTVTYASVTPTVVATLSKIGDLAAQVSTARQRVPSVVVMAPRRGFWLMSQADAQSRTFNPVDLAAPERDPNTEPVGSLFGMALVLDPAIPTNLGTLSNEDRIIVTRAADAILLEGGPRLTLNVSALSGTLTVRFGLYRYAAFLSGRVPSGTGVLSGTGLATPTFA